jgi:hypothetical protein
LYYHVLKFIIPFTPIQSKAEELSNVFWGNSDVPDEHEHEHRAYAESFFEFGFFKM